MSAVTPPAFYGHSRHIPAGAGKQGRFFWEYAGRASSGQGSVTDACRNAPAFFEAKRAFLLRLALLEPVPPFKRKDDSPPPLTPAQAVPTEPQRERLGRRAA